MMRDALLVLNAGSSSVKFSIFADGAPPQPLLRGQIEGLPSRPAFTAASVSGTVATSGWPDGVRLDHQGAIRFLIDWTRQAGGALEGHRLVAAGHRVVHGGRRFTAPTLVDGEIATALEELSSLAPLHQPHNVAAIRAIAQAAPGLPQVACFDTAFHSTQPAVAQALPLPPRYLGDNVRRYGFHGLSYEYVLHALNGHPLADGRIVVAHLGNGASMCAIAGGRSVATTMGYSTLDGLMMGTRCGTVDPGVLLYFLERYQMPPAMLRQLLYEQSGLLGVSGIASDMRALLGSRDPRAAEAIDLFVYRICRELGSLAAALGGIDALIFTGGIGENAAAIRARVCQGARWLGVDLDEDANAAGNACISRTGSRVFAGVVRTNEELMIAMHTRRVLAQRPAVSAVN